MGFHLKEWVLSGIDRLKGDPPEEEESTPPAQQATQQQTTALVASPPATTQPLPAQAEPVSGTFVPTGEPQTDATITITPAMLTTDAQKHTERFRKVVESFDEDKQEVVEFLVRKAVTIFCYLSPFALAFFIGMTVGDVFGASQTGIWGVIGIHLLSLFIEFAMPVLGLATVISFKRLLKDRNAWAPFASLAGFFLAVSVGNSLALLVVLEQGTTLDLTNFPTMAAMLVRSFGPLILDVSTALYLGIANAKSLKKYLADARKKVEAVRDINQVEIELDQASMKAAIDRVVAINELQARQERMNTFNEAERLTQKAVIEAMKKKLNDDDDTGAGSRSRYGRW